MPKIIKATNGKTFLILKKIVGVFMYFKIRASIYLTQMVVSK